MNFYTADLHFGHKGVILYDQRPFADVQEMDGVLISLWNSRVQKDDDVYVIGDFCYRSDQEPGWYLQQLKGKKHLIVGNHDGNLMNDEKAMSYFESVDKMLFIADNKERICLCHFPIAEWNGFYKGAWHIYGHIHNKKEETYQFMRTRDKALNAGCMINNFAPANFKELVENNKRFKSGEDEALQAQKSSLCRLREV